MSHRSPVASVLVVDDEPIIRAALAEYLQQERFAVQACGSGEDALDRAARHRFDVVLCDINLPGLDGIEVMERLARTSPETFVILVTAYATVETAVEAFQKGAHDYLTKPVLLHEVHAKLRRLLRRRELARENPWLRRELNRDDGPGEMVVGHTPAVRRAVEAARRAAPAGSPVLLAGEEGTGKELLARAVHRLAQADGRFVAVQCAAPPDALDDELFAPRHGAFVRAGVGTVFLDEVGELLPAAQLKLLRALEDGGGPRVVAATTRDLPKAVAAGRFREDLYYRLAVVAVRLPPLRDRREDIPELAEFLLARHARAAGKRFAGVSHDAMKLLAAAPWKGNVRELENALQRAVILGDGPFVTPADLPGVGPADTDPSAVDDLNEAVTRFERAHIERVLRQSGDKKEAARRLGIGLSSLYRKIEQLGIQPGP